MIHVGILWFTQLVLLRGAIITLQVENTPKAPTLIAALMAEQVEGSYKWKTVTITPGINFGKGPVTDMLGMMKTNDKCVQDMIVTFRRGGAVSIAKPASCEEQLGMGITEKSNWVRSDDMLIVTESDGTSTKFALSFSGSVMRLSGKVSISPDQAEKKDHLLTIELVRQ